MWCLYGYHIVIISMYVLKLDIFTGRICMLYNSCYNKYYTEAMERCPMDGGSYNAYDFLISGFISLQSLLV